MSVVTNLILCIGTDDADNNKIAEVNQFLEKERHNRGLVSLDDESLPDGWYGGTKYLEADIFVGAFNKLDLKGFVEYLRGLSWAEPQCVQILVKEQDDERFTLLNVFDKGE